MNYRYTPKEIGMLNDEIERLRAALIQIREVCDDNAPASCNQAMALAFVRSVVVHTLNEQKQDT